MSYRFSVVVVLYYDLPMDYSCFFRNNPGVSFILIDNTPGRCLKNLDDRVDYIPLYKNMGIAFALNIGCSRAIKKYGADWILTLDQDSVVPIDMLQKYAEYLAKCDKSNIGLLCPVLKMYEGEHKVPSLTVTEVAIAATSGSLINVDAYRVIGGFRNELFIDEVDSEFCYHLRTNGFNIYRLDNIIMQHHLGNTREYKFFGIHLFYVLHHSCIRHYYMQRNSLYVRDLYKNDIPELNVSLFRLFLPSLKILIFEKDKLLKLKSRYRGYCDYKRMTFGEYLA